MVPESIGRRLAWAACSWLAAGLWALARHLSGGEARFVLELSLVVLVYGPALWFVLKPLPVPPHSADQAAGP